MRKLLAVAALSLSLIPAAHADVWRWTILTQVCWRVQPTQYQRGQCAVGLQGTFRDLDECKANNRGLVQTDVRGSSGELIGKRCELLLPR